VAVGIAAMVVAVTAKKGPLRHTSYVYKMNNMSQRSYFEFATYSVYSARSGEQ
jgi:hypothetical protein